VHVWRASLRRPASDIHELRSLLSEDERDRAAKFHFARDRDDFTVARAALRVILGGYLGLPPGRLRFSYTSYGKPSLDESAGVGAPRFNLSHAGGVALYAVAHGREVGVDVEQVRDDMACRDVAERFFSRREVAALCALPQGAQTRAFFDCWTRKEAYVKARGEGLSMPLDSFDVSLSPGEPAALLDTRGDAREASRWSLRELSPGPGYVAAVAVEGDGWRLRCWRWDA
jgi:4'-phosphopantetheinyl transferase